jgi:hypothetical protein
MGYHIILARDFLVSFSVTKLLSNQTGSGGKLPPHRGMYRDGIYLPWRGFVFLWLLGFFCVSRRSRFFLCASVGSGSAMRLPGAGFLFLRCYGVFLRSPSHEICFFAHTLHTPSLTLHTPSLTIHTPSFTIYTPSLDIHTSSLTFHTTSLTSHTPLLTNSQTHTAQTLTVTTHTHTHRTCFTRCFCLV